MSSRLKHLVLGVGLLLLGLIFSLLLRHATRLSAEDDRVVTITLPVNDVVYSAVTDRLYASVPSSAGDAMGNKLIAINPRTGAIGPGVFVGSEPAQLAISTDEQYVYVGLDGAAAVRRFDVTAQTLGPAFSLGDSDSGPLLAEDISVMPGKPGTIAVALRYSGGSPRHAGVAIYDDGVRRAGMTPGHTGANSLAFSDDPSVLYGQNIETTECGFRRMLVDDTGVSVVDVAQGLTCERIEHEGGLVFSESGATIDPAVPALAGTYNTAGAVESDSDAGRTYFVSRSLNPSSFLLDVYDRDTFTPIAALVLPVVGGSARSLIRWGEDGVAFIGQDHPLLSGNYIVIVESPIVRGGPKPTPLPTPTPTELPTPTFELGDVNCDGVKDSRDALLILQFAARLIFGHPCFEHGDINGDGRLDAIDATLVLQFAAGL